MSTEHLSALELDEQATGAVVSPHLASCAECTAKVAARKAEAAAFLLRPDAKAMANAIVERHAKPETTRVPKLVLVLGPLAAALLLFFAWPRAEQPIDRIKGTAAVFLLDETGTPVTTAKPRQELVLAVRVPGDEHERVKVQVTSIEPDGGREALYGGTVEANGRAQLMKLEVTPGDVRLEAEFDRSGTRLKAELTVEVK
jgi:hypothetical protein